MSNKSLRFKLMALSGGMALVLLVVGGIGISTTRELERVYGQMVDVTYARTDLLTEMRLHSLDAGRLYLRLLVPGQIESENQRLAKEFKSVVAKYEDVDAAYRAIPFSPGEKGKYDVIAGAWGDLKPAAVEFVDLFISVDGEQRAAALEKLKKVGKLRNKHGDSLEELVAFQKQRAAESVAEAKAIAHRGTLSSYIVVAGGFLASLFFGLLFANRLSSVLRCMAEQLSQGSAEVANASRQISSASEELSSCTQEQAASLEQTSSSIEEMTSTIARNSENADRSSEAAGRSQSSAQRGKEIVDEMIGSMDRISDRNLEVMRQVEAGNAEIQNIVKVIAEIGEKTKVINDIVFQTKLLSFNASVEAARAGEHGKGFAVVAEEVGNLAQMSGNAAKEISSLLENSIQQVEGIVRGNREKVESIVTRSRKEIDAGADVAKRCRDVLDEIVRNVAEVTNMAADIANASREQTQGISEINKAMSQLDQTTQANASASHQAAASAEELTRQAEMLNKLVVDLRKTVEGTGTASTTDLKRPTGVSAVVRPGTVKPAVGKVLDFKSPRAQEAKSAPVKAAAGSDVVPQENHPGFKDF